MQTLLQRAGKITEEDPGEPERKRSALPVECIADEESLLRIFAGAAPHCSIQRHFAYLERALLVVIAAMSLPDARVLHRRLARGASCDPLAEVFLRLASERRGRILAFLRDAPRRQATAGAARRSIAPSLPVTAV
jgi:hypothetical protein